jgi:hypothetical protein
MLASEFIARMKDLMDVIGDRPVVIEYEPYRFELAAVETQKVVPVRGKWQFVVADGDSKNVQTVIKVW